eukprot:5346402-Alexandrium_andersonii.AAC.1
MNKFGRKRPAAEDMWNDYAKQPGWVREDKGYKGQVRMWLPKKDFKELAKETYIDGGVTESSDRKKKPNAAEVDALRRHAHEMFHDPQGVTFNNEFFQGRSTVAAATATSSTAAGSGDGDIILMGDEDNLGMDSSPPASVAGSPAKDASASTASSFQSLLRSP